MGGGGSHIDWRKERVPARMLSPEWGWIVMSHIGWGGEHEGKPERESPKRTISASGGPRPLQDDIVSKKRVKTKYIDRTRVGRWN